MADTKIPDEDQRVYTADKTAPSKSKAYPANPTTMDYFKEAFLPTDQRAQLEAVRNASANAKARSGS